MTRRFGPLHGAAHGPWHGVNNFGLRVGEFPASSAEFQALTTKSLSELFLMDEAAGSLVGEVAATTLTVNGAPTFQAGPYGGRRGLYYTTNGQGHRAASPPCFTTGANSFWVGVVYCLPATLVASTQNVVGRRGTDNAFWQIDHLNGLPYPRGLARTAAGTLYQLTLSSVDMGGGNLGRLALVQLQRDNSTSRFRMRISPSWGYGGTREVDIAIDPAQSWEAAVSPLGGFGAITGINGTGIANVWCGVINGADAEGASLMSSFADQLGWE
jgi:hypothetical protein